MRAVPYGYVIVDGVITVDEEKAKILRDMCRNYLSGASLRKCAEDAGLNMKHRGIGCLLGNKTYLGTEFFPKILTEEMMDAIDAERKRRACALGKDHLYERKKSLPTYAVRYSIKKFTVKYKNPVKQAEYAYEQIKEERVKI